MANMPILNGSDVLTYIKSTGAGSDGDPYVLERTAGGYTTVVHHDLIRPANTTAYVAGQVIGTAATHVLTFANCGRINGGSGRIFGAHLTDSANKATKLTAELWLFSVAPAAQVDQATLAVTDAEIAYFLGVIQFNNWFVGNPTADAAGNAVCPAIISNDIAFVCVPGSTTLYGFLVARNGYTPVSAEQLSPFLRIEQN